MPKTNRFRRGLAPLAVLALAVLLLGTVWLHLGWRAIDVTLEDQAGDPAALRGFTLNGRINWNYDNSSLHFSLHDGYLDTELVFDDEDASFLDRPMVSTDQTYVVATSERANAERNAAEVPQFTNSTVTVQTVVARVDRMYTLRVRFPGNDTRFVRFSAGAVDLEQPLVAESWVNDKPYELDYRYDYAINDPGAAVQESWSDSVVDARPFLLGDTPVVCWERDYLSRAPGLYRVHGLTEAEIADLPRDGTRYGEEILCGTTEIGSLEPFYCPEGAVEALTGAAMVDGSSLLLYLDADNTLWADLVDENGSCTDHQQVTELPAGDVCIQCRSIRPHHQPGCGGKPVLPHHEPAGRGNPAGFQTGCIPGAGRKVHPVTLPGTGPRQHRRGGSAECRGQRPAAGLVPRRAAARQ